MSAIGHYLQVPWPANDFLRLMHLLGGRDSTSVVLTSVAHHRRFSETVVQFRRCESSSDSSAREKNREVLEINEAMHELDRLLKDASEITGTAPLASLGACCNEISALETSMHTEMRYVHGPDWEIKPGKLISKKGTWLKQSTRFSWEMPISEKLYLPEGIALPVLQIGRVTSKTELKLHEWSSQHFRVWLKPPILKTLEGRREVWFVYWPHFEAESSGTTYAIVTGTDTWMKRSCQMSGELQPFELIYVPKGMHLHLVKPPAVVDEDWERHRHGHVHQHRRIQLAAPPLTMRRDKYDIFVGQPEDKMALLR